MKDKIFELYALVFAKPLFVKINRFLLNLALRGLGILNYKSDNLTGEKKWLYRYLKNIKNPIVIDVGANIGDYTNTILNINKNAKVFAIEPHPKTFKKLKVNIISENIQLFNVGISDRQGILELFDYKNNDGSSHASLYEDVIEDLHKGEVVSHKVEVNTLDELIGKKVDRIDLLKIDTEGNEYKVLLGARQLLNSQKINAIQFEFNEMNIISKTTFKDFWDLLSEQYIFYRILPCGNLLKIKKYTPLECEIYAYQNIICLKKNLKFEGY